MPRFWGAFGKCNSARTAHHPIAFFLHEGPLGKSSYHPASWHLEERQWSWDPLAHLELQLRSEPSYLVQLLLGRYSSGHYLGWATISRISPTTNFGSRSLTKRSAKPSLSNSWFKRATCSSVKRLGPCLRWRRKMRHQNIPGNGFLLVPHGKRGATFPFLSTASFASPLFFKVSIRNIADLFFSCIVTIMFFSHFNPAKNDLKGTVKNEKVTQTWTRSR